MGWSCYSPSPPIVHDWAHAPLYVYRAFGPLLAPVALEPVKKSSSVTLAALKDDLGARSACCVCDDCAGCGDSVFPLLSHFKRSLGLDVDAVEGEVAVVRVEAEGCRVVAGGHFAVGQERVVGGWGKVIVDAIHRQAQVVA